MHGCDGWAWLEIDGPVVAGSSLFGNRVDITKRDGRAGHADGTFVDFSFGRAQIGPSAG